MLNLYPLDTSSVHTCPPQLWQSNMSPDPAKCSLGGGNHTPLENHCPKWNSGPGLSAKTFFLLYSYIGWNCFSHHLDTACMLRTPEFISLPVSPQIQRNYLLQLTNHIGISDFTQLSRILHLLQTHFPSTFPCINKNNHFLPSCSGKSRNHFLFPISHKWYTIILVLVVTYILNVSTSLHKVQISPSLSWTVLTASTCSCFYYSLFYYLFSTQQPRCSIKNENWIAYVMPCTKSFSG